MKKLLFFLFALTGCASTQPVITPPCPGPVTVYVRDTVRTTTLLHDTTFTQLLDTVIQTNYLFRDTTAGDIIIAPMLGDNYPQLQAAIDFCITHPGHKIRLLAGDFHISHPLIVAKLVNRDFIMVAVNIEGAVNAKNTLQAYTTNIFPDYTNGPAIILQLNKGTEIKNIHFGGKFQFPNNLSPIAVDTLSAAQWTDGICRDTRTSPYAAIVIDPFGDPISFNNTNYPMYPGLEAYYLPGMSRNGSTAINIEGCSIYDFVVGILVTGAYQYNGELINVTDCRIDNCKVCYAYSQAQSKANTVNDLMVWGGVHTIIDGANYGFPHNDASTAPFIDVMNIAGSVYQLFDVYASTFPLSAKRVYSESMHRIGIVSGLAGAHFDDFQIDFPHTGGGVPSPAFIYQGVNTTWTSCMLRLYDGHPSRLILDCPQNTFTGGSMNAPPVIWNTSAGGSTPNLATFQNVGMQYTNGAALNGNGFDSRIGLGNFVVHINRADFTGYIVFPNLPGAPMVPGDLLVTTRAFDDFPSIIGSNYPVGVVTAVSGDTVLLQNMGVGIHDGETISITKTVLK